MNRSTKVRAGARARPLPRALPALAALAALAAPAACEERFVHLVPGFFQAPLDGGPRLELPESGQMGSEDAGGMWFGDATTRREGGLPSCADDHHVPEAQPLGVYMMVDQSSSMRNAWPAMVDAIRDFVRQSGSLHRVSVGLQYFIASTPPSIFPDVALCNSATYVEPDVPIALLPGNEELIETSLAAHGPASLDAAWGLASLFLPDSPTDAALTGAIEGARRWRTAHASEDPRAVVLLVTDAVPSPTASPNCRPDLTLAVDAASTGFSGDPSIATFVLGVGDALEDLDRIAAAGGTSRAHLVETATTKDILDALGALRSVALPCDFSANPSRLSSSRVNVQLHEGASSTTTFRRVNTAAECPAEATDLAWYGAGVDRIVLCPGTCGAVRSAREASLDVVYGCPTVSAH